MRSRLLLILAIFLAGILLSSARATAQDVQNFTVEVFDATYQLSRGADKSSRLDVQETITAKFPEYDQNHGILRALPMVYQGHSLGLKIFSVTDEQASPIPYTTYEQNDNQVLKIGRADTFVHGLKTYKIHYSLQDVISFYKDHDELFWDTNGDQWPQPFTLVTAHVIINKSIADALMADSVCFAGYAGSTNQNCQAKSSDQGGDATVDFTASALRPYQTMSFALKFRPGTFRLSPAVQRAQQLELISLVSGLVLALAIPLTALIFMYRRWRQFGDDPKGRGIIVPQYQPLKEIDVLSAGFLMEQRLAPQALSAVLIDLAVKKHLTIYEIPKKGLFGKTDYQLEMNSLPESVSPETGAALNSIFGSPEPGSKVALSELRGSRDSQTRLLSDMKKIEDDLAKNLHSSGYFIKNPKAVRNGYLIWAGLLLLAGAGLAFLGISLSVAAAGLAGLGVILAAVVVFGFSFIMPAKTQKGVEAYDYLRGLKDYIKMAEAERLRYLQSPEGAEKIPEPDKFDPKDNASKVKLFEDLLPYAMLFGLEKKWAEQFSGIYVTPPDWYHGNWAAFNAAYLGSSLSGFSGAASSSFAAPSSSGSGFSGGGAGGGGGGGGGGGW